MIKVDKQLDVGKYTALVLNTEPPNNWNGIVRIGGKEYKTVMVFDLPKTIALIGKGDFVGENIEFIKFNYEN